MTGLTNSPATKVVRKFEDLVGSREDLAEKLGASGKAKADELKLMELLETAPKNKSLASLMAEANVRPSRVLQLYAEGAISLGKIEAAIEVSREQPQVIKDLLRHALDKQVYCQTCVGTGTVKKRSNSTEETLACPSCDGSGVRLRSSKHKQFAMEKVLKIGKVIEEPKRGTEVNVSQQVGVGVSVGQGGGFMERVLKTQDEVLYGRRTEIVDAEPASGAPSEGNGDPEAEVQGAGDDGPVVDDSGASLSGAEEGEEGVEVVSP
jgi:Zn finger protein HypA/HybF involved in hydrogenase expression